MQTPSRSSESPLAHAPLWLADAESRVLKRPACDMICPLEGPELEMEIEFFGITEAELPAALAAFPGGRRFVLKHRG